MTNRYPIKWKLYETMTLDLEPEKLSKGFAKVNKTISQISPRPQTQCSEGEIILIQTMTKKRLLFSKRFQRNHLCIYHACTFLEFFRPIHYVSINTVMIVSKNCSFWAHPSSLFLADVIAILARTLRRLANKNFQNS